MAAREEEAGASKTPRGKQGMLATCCRVIMAWVKAHSVFNCKDAGYRIMENCYTVSIFPVFSHQFLTLKSTSKLFIKW